MKIETVESDAPRPLDHYSGAVVAGPWVFAADQITGVPEQARRHVLNRVHLALQVVDR